LNLEHPVPSLLGALARAGFASVRVERSGLGDSEGPPCARIDFDGELTGYRAGFNVVRARPWVDAKRVFVLGHSLGTMVAPLLADEGAPAGIACFAASALPISSALAGAVRRHARVASGDPATWSRAEKIAELIDLVVTQGGTPHDVLAARPDLRAAAPDHFSGDQAYHRIVTFYHQLERVDVAGAWRAFRRRSLFVYGERDYVCSADDSRVLVEIAGTESSFVSLPGVDHQMSDRAGGAPVLAPAVAEAIIEWLRTVSTAI
jgi:pimeloyl-ACP methyl ester carboxylesterase